jgi:hypothetical protein
MQKNTKRVVIKIWIGYRDQLIKQHPLKLLYSESILPCNLNYKQCVSCAVKKNWKGEFSTMELNVF